MKKYLDSSNDLLNWVISSRKFFIILSTVDACKDKRKLKPEILHLHEKAFFFYK